MKLLTTMLLLISTVASAGNITLNANDGFKLHGSYYAGQTGKPGVLMLHQCNAERSMYNELGRKLAAQGIHALSLDFRMYGDSVTEVVALQKIRDSAADRQSARKKIRVHRQKWPTDVQLAEQFLRDKIGKNASLGVIGASCGGGQAIMLAQDTKVNALMFFSSGMNQDTLDAYQMLDSTPTYIIAAQGDTFTFDSSQKLFKNAIDPQTRLINYKGRGHGYPLFKHDPALADNMVTWFKAQLMNSLK